MFLRTNHVKLKLVKTTTFFYTYSYKIAANPRIVMDEVSLLCYFTELLACTPSCNFVHPNMLFIQLADELTNRLFRSKYNGILCDLD